MRNLFLTYSENEKLQPLVAEIGWTHNLVIMEKCKDDLEREFYLRMTRRFGWTKNVPTHQIENKTYEKAMLGQTNFEEILPEEIRGQARLAVKDKYTFDFLELGDEYGERQLETAILGRIEPFLREMSGVFSFIGSQYRLEVGDQEYFVDLFLHHRRLRCLVAIELKIGEFLPEYAGKMQFYLAARTKAFSPKFMPADGIYSTAGQASFLPRADLEWGIGLLSSKACNRLIRRFTTGTPLRKCGSRW